jgi:lysyl-tRNA synthetase class 2
MLEWYRLGFTYHQLMKEVEALLQSILTSAHENSCFVSYRELFLEVLGFDPHIANNSELQNSMAQQQLDVMGELDHTAMLDVLMTHCIEPTFAEDRLTFVYDYPAEQKALATLSDDEVPVAQRFEVYWGAVELGNGYQEQTDADMNASILQSDLNKREAKGMTNIPIDEQFIAALRQGLPMCSGVAIGLDRLLMCQLNKKNLQEVISFPWTVA